MSYDALTIDTQVVHANQLELDKGMAAQIRQFQSEASHRKSKKAM